MFNFNAISQTDPCKSCRDAVDLYQKMVSSMNIASKNYRLQKDSLFNIIESLENEITNKDKFISDSKIKISNKNVNTFVGNYKDVIQLKKTIKSLESNKSESERNLKKQKRTISYQNSKIDNLNRNIISQVNTIDTQKKLINILRDEMSRLQDIVDCLNQFKIQRNEDADLSYSKILEARKIYETYLTLKNKKESKVKDLDSLIIKVLDTYSTYKTSTRFKKCGNVDLSFVADNLGAIDHFYIAKIYAHNEGNAVERLESKNKINEATERLLTNVGMSLNKGFYNDQSLSKNLIEDFGDIMNSIGYFAVSDRRADSENSELIASFRKILEAYTNQDYVKAISIYNKYNRYKTLESISSQNEMLDEIDYCIGSILAWNLADLKQNQGLYIEGSWLDNIDGDINIYGENMLKTLLKKKELKEELRKKCIIALSKLYATF